MLSSWPSAFWHDEWGYSNRRHRWCIWPLVSSFPQLATTESGAEDNDCSNVDGVELQAPGVPKQFTIDGGDSDGESPTHRNGAVQQFDDQEVHVAANSPNQEKDGVMYSLANFEPQQHTDLTWVGDHIIFTRKWCFHIRHATLYLYLECQHTQIASREVSRYIVYVGLRMMYSN